MATTVYPTGDLPDSAAVLWGGQFVKISGSSFIFIDSALSTSRGTTAYSESCGTVAGPTSGVEYSPSAAHIWITPPLAEDVTISGTITFNLRALESSMSANAAVNARLLKVDCQDLSITEFCKTARTTELGTSEAAANFTATPTSTSFTAGDRIIFVPFYDDAGTMVTGYTCQFYYGGPTAAGTGDSYVTFTETFSFQTALPGAVKWTEAAYSANGYMSVAYDGSSYMAAVEAADLWYCTDPTGTWTQNAAIGAGILTSIAYANGYWVAVSTNGSVYYRATNPTGTFTAQTTGTVQFQGVAYGNGYWVAVGDTGKMYYRASTPNGSWTLKTVGTVWWTSVAYGNGYWVAVGPSGALYYATDPTGTWTSNTTGSSGLTGVIYGNGYWVAVGSSGAVFYKATDPTGSWTSNTQGTSNFTHVSYADGFWFAGFAAGFVTSNPGSAWTVCSYGGTWGYTPSGTGAMVSNGTTWAVAMGNGSVGKSAKPSPTTTTYLTNTSAGINPGSATEYEIWTSRGDGVANGVRNTAAGWTSPLQWTDTAGGTAIEWYTKPLLAVTLESLVQLKLRALSSSSSNASVHAEIAICGSDGSSPVVWAKGVHRDYIATTETSYDVRLAGPSTAITEGQRIRVRVYIDDHAYGAMAASKTATLYYDGTTPGASGDSYVLWPVALTEFSVPGGGDELMPYAGGGYYPS